MPVAHNSSIDHYEYPVRFLDNIASRDNLVIRGHSLDRLRGSKEQTRLISKYSHLEIDKIKSFYNSLEHSNLLIIDHPGTCFYESLQCLKPTILFL